MLRVPKPWKPGGRYEVEVKGLRNLSGVSGDSRGALTVAPPVTADSSARGLDSLRRRPDSLKRQPTKKAP